MHKKMSLFFVSISLIISILVLTEALKRKHVNSQYYSSDTESLIDLSTTRDFFNTVIASIDARNLQTIDSQGTHIIKQYPSMSGTVQLFKQFIRYQNDLQNISRAGYPYTTDIRSLEVLDTALLNRQKYYFTPSQQEVLFEEENTLRSLALTKLRFKADNKDDDSFQQQWQAYLQKLPEYIQHSEENARLIASLKDIQNTLPETRLPAYTQLVGEDAAERLQTLDHEIITFNKTLETYISNRRTILTDKTLAEEEQLQAIEELREATFNKSEHRRVMALERIKDERKQRAEKNIIHLIHNQHD